MPFTAIVEGSRVNALAFLPGEWRDLKKRKPDVEILPCRHKGHLVTRKGTRFFRHNPGIECTWEKESPEHRECKRIIYETAIAMGYRADVEVLGDGWRADVLIKTPSNDFTFEKLAFEIQLSDQSLAETITRSKKYQSSGVLPIWLMTEGMEKEASAWVPAFKVDVKDLMNPKVWLSESECFELADFVRRVLLGAVALEMNLDDYHSEDLPSDLPGLSGWDYIVIGGLGLLAFYGLRYLFTPRK